MGTQRRYDGRTTRVFDLMRERQWSLRETARRLEDVAPEAALSHAAIAYVRQGKVGISARFMDAFERLFPEYDRDYLFPRTDDESAA